MSLVPRSQYATFLRLFTSASICVSACHGCGGKGSVIGETKDLEAPSVAPDLAVVDDLGTPLDFDPGADPCYVQVANNPLYSGGVSIPGGNYCLFTRAGASFPVAGAPVLGSDPTPWAIHLSLASDPATTMAVNWRTNDETTLASTVQWGENGATDHSTDGYTFTFSEPPVRQHQGHLVGLKPATTYSYRVGGQDSKGNQKWSPVFTFHTAPAPGSAAPVSVVLMGDTRDSVSHYVLWGKMLAAADAAASPDLVLFSGDAVTAGTTQSEWDDFLRVAQPVLTHVAMVNTMGNHEANAVNYFSQFAMPADGEYFGLDYGPVHLTVLNDTPAIPGDYLTVAVPFLQGDLTAHDSAPWKFLLHHQPPYSAGVVHGSDMELRAAWVPIYDAHDVDLVLNGHDHDYQRSKPIRGGQFLPNPAQGATYIVAGSAGAPLYGVAPAGFNAAEKVSYSFVTMKVRAGAIAIVARDDLGNQIDSLSYSK